LVFFVETAKFENIFKILLKKLYKIVDKLLKSGKIIVEKGGMKYG